MKTIIIIDKVITLLVTIIAYSYKYKIIVYSKI